MCPVEIVRFHSNILNTRKLGEDNGKETFNPLVLGRFFVIISPVSCPIRFVDVRQSRATPIIYR